jgi:hypothetical protein
MDIFAKGTDNSLEHLYYEGGWGEWESLGGILIGAPAVASWGAYRLDIFIKSNFANLRQKTYDG